MAGYKTTDLMLIENHIKENKMFSKEDILKWIKVVVNEDTGTAEYFFIPTELANYMKTIINYIFVRSQASDSIMIYAYIPEKGKYEWISDDQFKGLIASCIPYKLHKSRDIEEVFKLIKCNANIDFVDVDELDNNEDIINMTDGLLNIKTHKLMPHSPEILSTIQIPFKYEDIKNSSGDCPVFLGYLDKLCNRDGFDMRLIMQCIGLTISNIYGYRAKKSLFLIGKGDTGKSQIKEFLARLIGKEKFSPVDLKKLNEKFGASSLYAKRLVGCNDMTYQKVEDMSIFKQLTGGDSIEIEFKNKTPFSYIFKGFLWFNANKMPRFGGDHGKWVYDRVMIIEAKNPISPNEQDKLIVEKMLQEGPSIIKWALQELDAFVENGYTFTEGPNILKNRELYKIENNTFLEFIIDCCDVLSETREDLLDRTKRSDLNSAYNAWCEENDIPQKYRVQKKDRHKILAENFNELQAEGSRGDVYLNTIYLYPEARKELLGSWEERKW